MMKQELDLSKYEGHTEGPWGWDSQDEYIRSMDGEILAITHCSSNYKSDEELQANADLLSDAPKLLNELRQTRTQRDELLECLEDLIGYASESTPLFTLRKAREAIANSQAS